ncbi:MAG: LacI family transcriptional regulator [Propionibacteriaceae bacterium]|jgi:LacI family transcriptional regulator|nr:LacI family transcriptional regulator [Propionibacteriaceae bacterium]
MGRQPGTRVSIVDVAREAGVSVGTASNVLNKPERVAKNTRRRVEQVIERLGYVPSGPARALRSGQIRTVGAVLLDIRNPFYTQVTRGIEDRLEEDEFMLFVGSSDGKMERETRYLNVLESRGVAGMILSPAGDQSKLLRDIAGRGVPIVLLEASYPDVPASSVLVDNVAGGELAARHLAEIGCEHLLMFNGPNSIPQCHDRAAGALRGWVGAGRSEATFSQVLLTSMDIAGGDDTAAPLFDDLPAKTGLFAVNDLVAIGVQRALRKRGGYNPAAFPLVGYDDIDLTSVLAVPMTTIRQPTYDIGRRAAELLLHRHAHDPIERVTLVPELVVRESTTLNANADRPKNPV